MCGRFTQKIGSSALARIFAAEDLADLPGDRYNVAPTDAVAAVYLHEGARIVAQLRWGLVPHWAVSAREAAARINARAETVDRTPAFRHAFERRRCLIPADGFYEWRRLPDGGRIPYYVTHRDGLPFAFAGLRATWHEGSAPPLRTCSIVTTTPNDLIAPLHNRMPVILAPAVWDLWLDPATNPGQLRALLCPVPPDELVMYPVSRLVNSVRNNGPELVQPVEPPIQQPLLP